MFSLLLGMGLGYIAFTDKGKEMGNKVMSGIAVASKKIIINLQKKDGDDYAPTENTNESI